MQHLAGLMDARRDTLFLFLTSHGEEGKFAVQMPGISTRHLTPTGLKDMLDRAGIARRVIVVSACHAGSFIPALAGPTSLVIAAARADRSSFGCEDRRRWTYFGDAYFNRALRAETSFRMLDAKAVMVTIANPAGGFEPITRSAYKPIDGSWKIDGLTIPGGGLWSARLEMVMPDSNQAARSAVNRAAGNGGCANEGASGSCRTPARTSRYISRLVRSALQRLPRIPSRRCSSARRHDDARSDWS